MSNTKNKVRKLVLAIVVIFLIVSEGFSQGQFKVTYSRTRASWGIDDTQTLLYKDGVAIFSFDQQKETKEVDFYEINLAHTKYLNSYDVVEKTMTEQNELEDRTLVLGTWKQEFDWTLTQETKTINGYLCQKATGQSFNYPKGSGSDYGIVTAWFTTEIPVPIGPGGILLTVTICTANVFHLKAILQG